MKQNNFFSKKLLKNLTNKNALSIMYIAQDESHKQGFDFFSVESVMKKVEEEFRELQDAFKKRGDNPTHFYEELGDCFFTLVNLARHIGKHPGVITKQNAKKYLLRCQYIEKFLQKNGKSWKDLSYEEITILWKKAKVNKS